MDVWFTLSFIFPTAVKISPLPSAATCELCQLFGAEQGLYQSCWVLTLYHTACYHFPATQTQFSSSLHTWFQTEKLVLSWSQKQQLFLDLKGACPTLQVTVHRSLLMTPSSLQWFHSELAQAGTKFKIISTRTRAYVVSEGQQNQNQSSTGDTLTYNGLYLDGAQCIV